MARTTVINANRMMELYGIEASRDAPTSHLFRPIVAGIGENRIEKKARQFRCLFGCRNRKNGSPNFGTVWFDEGGFCAHLHNRHLLPDKSAPKPHEYKLALLREKRLGENLTQNVETPATILARQNALLVGNETESEPVSDDEITEGIDMTQNNEIADLKAAVAALAQTMKVVVEKVTGTEKASEKKAVNPADEMRANLKAAGVPIPEGANDARVKALHDAYFNGNAPAEKKAEEKKEVAPVIKREDFTVLVATLPLGEKKRLHVFTAPKHPEHVRLYMESFYTAKDAAAPAWGPDGKTPNSYGKKADVKAFIAALGKL